MKQQWKALPLGERWRLGRAANMGRCEPDAIRARLVAWRAGHALRQLRWMLPLTPLLFGAVYGLASWLGGTDLWVLAVFHTAFYTVFYAIVVVPRLRRAVRLNTRVVADAEAGLPTRVLTEPADRRVRFAWAVGAVGAVVLLWGLTAASLWRPAEHRPETLADGGPPGVVPQPVAALAEGPVLAGRVSPGLPDDAEQCDVVAEWQSGPVIRPAVVTDRSTFVVHQGVGRARFFGMASWIEPADRPTLGSSVLDPQPLIALCEYDERGGLIGFAVGSALPIDGEHWFGGYGSSGRVAPDRHVTATADWRVPDGATWALLKHTGWTLATPVDDGGNVMLELADG